MKKEKRKMKKETHVSERVRAIRKALDLNQKEFAEGLQAAGSSVSDVENGKYTPNFDLIRNLVKEFKVNIDYLLFGEGEMFMKPGRELFLGLEDLSNRNEGVRKFLDYFEKSAIFRYKVMGNAEELLIDNFQGIQQEIKSYGEKNEKPMSPKEE
jgi:transcriptional regulator with XRE-family HTH domain